MALEVSSRQMKSDSKAGLITRDFLGGGGGGGGCSSGIESKELDLDLHVPSGWEKHLDLKSGKVYIQKSSPTTSEHKNNFTNTKPTLNLLDKSNLLDLKLLSNPPQPSTYYSSSVCTLDKVKSALDRVDRSSPASTSSSSRKRVMVGVGSSSPSNSSSLSVKENEDEVEKVSSDEKGGLLVAAACSECFLYVLISKDDPKCPKCNSVVKLPVMPMKKKPKIDLNIAI